MDNIGDILSSLSDEDMKALGDAARSLLGSSEQEQGQMTATGAFHGSGDDGKDSADNERDEPP